MMLVAVVGSSWVADMLLVAVVGSSWVADMLLVAAVAVLGASLIVAWHFVRSPRARSFTETNSRSVGRPHSFRIWQLVLGVGLIAVQPVLTIVLVLSLRVRHVAQRRRRAREEATAVDRALAEVIDLFSVGLASGLTTLAATQQVSRWSHGVVAVAFDACIQQTLQGRTLSDSLEQVPSRLGQQVRPLVAALVAHERHGAPIGQSLTRLAADSRADRRRRAETQARRLPVALLFPLVVCVLPAFLLLTVVPVVAETVSAFELFASP